MLLQIGFYISSLMVYDNLKNDPVISNLFNISKFYSKLAIKGFRLPDIYEFTEYYTALCRGLMDKKDGLSGHLMELIKYDLNQFSTVCANGGYADLKDVLKTAVESDLKGISSIACLTSGDIKSEIRESLAGDGFLLDMLPDYNAGEPLLFTIGDLRNFYEKNGAGIFAKYNSFSIDEQKRIIPVENYDNIKLSDLKRYEFQKESLISNTEAFLNGKPYNNVLLYGDRGTGKSSTVKALINEYGSCGLKIIEISKKKLVYINALITNIIKLESSKLKFIIFVDDISFDEEDENINILKAVLEGSLFKWPRNAVIYATTNRRHIVREKYSSRSGDEVHLSDAIDETLSLSDRFGLIITYSKPDKSKFLDIVSKLAEDKNIKVDEELFKGAESFALLKSGRTPRAAKQYIDYIQSKM